MKAHFETHFENENIFFEKKLDLLATGRNGPTNNS